MALLTYIYKSVNVLKFNSAYSYLDYDFLHFHALYIDLVLQIHMELQNEHNEIPFS